MSDKHTILFITSNGTGLGHLTRSMAIARRLGDDFDTRIFTLSGAAPVVHDLGFPVEYMSSLATPGSGPNRQWNRRLAVRILASISELRPAVTVFDGVHPYWGLANMLDEMPDTVRVWSRRPLWKPGSNIGALDREGHFDEVLEPGELAEDKDRGPTVARRANAFRVRPIVYLDRDEMLPREQAVAELGLDPSRPHVLLQLGQGASVRGALTRCLDHLSHRDDVQVVALESAIHALGDVPDDVVHLKASYPMSRLYAAFDGVVSAAGYNAYHELVALGVPSLVLGMPRETDDQAARAIYTDETGIGVGLATPDDPGLEEKLDRLLDPAERARMKEALDALEPLDGASQAAEWIRGLAYGRKDSRRRAPDREVRGGFHMMRGRFLPPPKIAMRYVFHFVKSVLPSRRGRPVVILALGVGEEELRSQLDSILATSDLPPERHLVITDSLAFSVLRDAGVAFDHIPGPDYPERITEGDETFIERRITHILTERRQPIKALAIGDVDPALLVLATERMRVYW